MTPGPLIGTYKQYTIDSDAIAAWLAQTAAIYGYSMDKCTTQAATEQKVEQKFAQKAVHKSGRPKGKARKLAQQASSQNPSDSKNRGMKPNVVPERPKYLVSDGYLVPLAIWLANSTPASVEVPASFVFALDRAIRVRKTHFIWWYSKSKKDGGKMDEARPVGQSYDYLLGVLEKVREVLQPRMSPELFEDPLAQPIEQKPTSPDLKKPENDQLLNSFRALHFGEALETFLDTEPVTADQMPSAASQVEYCLDRVLDRNENHFAFYCLLHDFNVIRIYIQQVWDSYKHGVTDLIAASIATNTAIEIARGLQDDFTEVFSNLVDFDIHMHATYHVACENANHDSRLKARPDDEMNFEAYEEIETSLFPTYIILTFFNESMEPGVPPSYTGLFGSYEPKSDREWMLPKWKFREDKALLLELLPDFCVVAHGQSSIPLVDEMTHAILEMVKNDCVTPLLVLATQVYLDIHHTLRQKVSNGFQDLTKSARFIEKNIQQILAFHNHFRLDDSPMSDNEGLFFILDVIKVWVNLDLVQNVRMGMAESYGVSETPAESFLFLKNHPWYCGLLLCYIKVLAQKASIAFVNTLGSILSGAHLYHALRQEGLLTNVWPDMDLALLMHETEGSFIDGFFKTTADFCGKLSLAKKHSAKCSAKSRMYDGIVAAKSDPIKLSELAPLCAKFKNRFHSHESRIRLSSDDVKTILYLADSIEEWKILEFTMNTDLTSNVRFRTPIVQFLNALLTVIQAETLELTFDHFRLHIFCWNLLRNLRDALRGDLTELYGRGCFEEEKLLPHIVGYIIVATASATDTDKQKQTQKQKQKQKLADTGTSTSTQASEKGDKKDVITNQLLVKAAKVMNRMLKAGMGQSQRDSLKELGIQLRASLDFGEVEGE